MLCKEPGVVTFSIHDDLVGFVDSLVFELGQSPGALLQLGEGRPPSVKVELIMLIGHRTSGRIFCVIKDIIIYRSRGQGRVLAGEFMLDKIMHLMYRMQHM